MLRLAILLLTLISACQKDETVSGYADPGAVYVLQEIDGAAYAPNATLTLAEPGRIAGQAPCNSYSARQTLPYPWFGIIEITVTGRACPYLAAEAAFLDDLQAMTLAEVADGILILSNDAGREMVFRAK